MNESFTWKGFKLETPAKYRIRIEGHVDENLGQRLGDISITNAFKKDGQPVAVLVGYLPDQASLSGVLNALYDLHLTLLSVENLDEKIGRK